MAACAALLRSSVGIIEAVYGRSAVELAYEYRKLSEVLCNTGEMRDALHYAHVAREIFKQIYSHQHEAVADLDLLTNQIQQVLSM